ERFVRPRALGWPGLLAALTLGAGFGHEILYLVLELHDVRMGIVVAQPQRIELRLQFGDACPELPFTVGQDGHLRFTVHLPLERGVLHLGLPQFRSRVLDAAIERDQPRIEFYVAARARAQ